MIHAVVLYEQSIIFMTTFFSKVQFICIIICLIILNAVSRKVPHSCILSGEPKAAKFKPYI
jgi:hypothetical protein